MQAVAQDRIQETTPAAANGTQPVRRVITVEVVAILLLIGVSLLLRLVALGEVQITQTETVPALSAWRNVSPRASGETILVQSPVVFLAQNLTFSMLGGSEFAARILTSLAGVALSLSPLLFRDLFGRVRAYLFALLLVFSPVLLPASRFSSGTVWAMLFAVLGLWALWRYWESEQGRNHYGIFATIAFGALVFLSEPGGVLLGLILLGASAVAVWLTALDAPDKSDIPGNDFLGLVRERLHGWPWQSGLLLAALVVVAVSTGFMLNPGGLSSVAALLEGFVTGITQSAMLSRPLFFPLVVSLFYELWLWLFAIAAVVLVIRREEVTFVERFFLAWVLLAALASLIYQGTGAAHALWLTIPLAGLASYVVVDAFRLDMVLPLWGDGFLDDEDILANHVRWGKWLLALLMFALLMIVTIHFEIIARAFLNVPEGLLGEFVNRLGTSAFISVVRSLIWFFIGFLFIGVGYFLAASIWGNVAAARGGVVGFFAFVLLTGMGSGWNVAVDNANSPVELWHVRATETGTPLLRQTLAELAFRETLSFSVIPVAVVGEDTGILAWVVRDFPNARFVRDVSEARTEQLIIAPEMAEPDLGGSYVGQRFIIDRIWNTGFVQGFDVLSWWAERRARFTGHPGLVVILWVRQDIFDGRPFEPVSPGIG